MPEPIAAQPNAERTPRFSAALEARMLQFGDSMLPVGGFAFSGGLETAVEQGVVHDPETLRGFTLTVVEQASRSDAAATARTMELVRTGRARNEDPAVTAARPEEADRLVFARKLGEEARAMSLRMGKKLTETALHVTGSLAAAAWLERIESGRTPGTFPVSQGLVLAELGLSPEQGVLMHLYGVAVTVLNASLRLMRVTHLDIQALLFGLEPALEAGVRRALALPLHRMSGYAPMIDILASMHVRAHVRLFMN